MDEYANAAIPCQNYEITKKHNDCMHQAMRKFKENAKCINDAKSLNKYRDVLKEKLVQYSDGDVVGGYLHKILDQNEKKSDKFCRQLVNELLHEVSEPGKIYSLNEQYKERARGPQMWHVYKTVLAAKIEDISPTGMKECTSSDDNVNPVMSVSARAAEIEKMKAMMVQDSDDQQKQLETDFEERSAAILAQIETLRRTHQALVDELQRGLDNMREEKKVKQEELTRKQDEVMRQS
ncbi:uncharacterized protein [Ptychodera flava]|uniref:uncharacterized protein n=1 Tax=Ptychodera flava TaxID=63121 RepID=UPI00396A1303